MCIYSHSKINQFHTTYVFPCYFSAYSRKCYMCLSLEDESCSLNPKQEKFMFDCDNALYETKPLMKYLNVEGTKTSIYLKALQNLES